MKRVESDYNKRGINEYDSFESNLSTVIIFDILPCQDGLVISVSAFQAVGRGFAPRPDHTKDHHKNSINFLPAKHAGVRLGVWQCNATV